MQSEEKSAVLAIVDRFIAEANSEALSSMDRGDHAGASQYRAAASHMEALRRAIEEHKQGE